MMNFLSIFLSIIISQKSVSLSTYTWSKIIHLRSALYKDNVFSTTISPRTSTKMNHINMGGDLSLMNEMSISISKVLNVPFKADKLEGGYGGGGGGASTGIIIDSKTNQQFFYKSSNLYGYNMLAAEYQGIQDIYNTNTIRVPKPITIGTSNYNAYIIFEKLSLGGSGSSEEYARKIAAMHRCTSLNNQYGYKINNTIGATFQPNTFTPVWAEFWDKYRLGYMLDLCKQDGVAFSNEGKLREKVYQILFKHTSCVPSLIHGDLWSGNQAYTKQGEPVIFDPATYYGDREVDIAMTTLFGSNSKSFYETYQQEWPLPSGWELRRIIYNSYHILNHYVLFGGGYINQAKRMFEQIILSEEV